MKARKKPIEVVAIKYDKNIVLEDFLELLRSNKDEPVYYDESTKIIYIEKERGNIALMFGNWVIYELNTDKCFWAIDDDIFKRTYIKVNDKADVYKKAVYDINFVEFRSLNESDICNVLDFLNVEFDNNLIDSIKANEYIEIVTLEGIEKLYVSEILIKGIKGEFYPVKRVNFDKVYDIISE